MLLSLGFLAIFKPQLSSELLKEGIRFINGIHNTVSSSYYSGPSSSGGIPGPPGPVGPPGGLAGSVEQPSGEEAVGNSNTLANRYTVRTPVRASYTSWLNSAQNFFLCYNSNNLNLIPASPRAERAGTLWYKSSKFPSICIEL